jgi:hypothetical protein
MRYISSLFAVFLFSAFVANAQSSSESYPLYGALSASADGATLSAPAITLPQVNLLSPSAPAFGLTSPTPAIASPAEPAAPQAVTGVFEEYAWQVSGGYSFVRFYELPAITQNMNGFNFSLVYYFKDWIAADGEFAAAFGSQAGFPAHFLFGGGGPRFRWSAPRGLEIWGHGLLGHTHFTPQTADGPQGAFAYELGAGIDINAHHQRWAYRVEGDVIGSHYFGTYQFSPRISAGIVFKF